MRMKLVYKMILIFSVMVVILVTILSGYAARLSLAGSEAFTAARFRNIGSTMSRAIEQQVSMMDLTMEELLDSTSFMSALNQFVTNDSADGKVANAARSAVLQQLYRSPMVDNFYRVSFYTADGLFVTSRFQKDDYLQSGTDLARQVLSALPWLHAAQGQRMLLAPHNDMFSVRRDTLVFGTVRAVYFHGRMLGYIEVSSELSELTGVLDMVDEPDIMLQLQLDDGTVFYSDPGLPVVYPATLEENAITIYDDEAAYLSHTVMRTRSEWLEMNLFVAQDRSVVEQRNHTVRMTYIRTATLIILPTLAVIVLLSYSLTRSTVRLTRKVRQLPADRVLQNEPEAIRSLNETVTSVSDAEVHELETVFNGMMLRLRDSAMNEISLREGALQAQLSALQTQINPHFIYNTLNIISAKSMESGNLEVIEICDQFAQLLRYSTDTRSRTASLGEEIDNVRNYLLLAKARYEENLEFSIDIPPQLARLKVPKLTLQPIVENALNHGFNGQNALRRLSVTGKAEAGLLTLDIRDNGTGFSEDVLARLQCQIREIETDRFSIVETGGHIGLINTCLRLHYYSRGTMHISIFNDAGAVVRVTMPYREE